MSSFSNEALLAGIVQVCKIYKKDINPCLVKLYFEDFTREELSKDQKKFNKRMLRLFLKLDVPLTGSKMSKIYWIWKRGGPKKSKHQKKEEKSKKVRKPKKVKVKLSNKEHYQKYLESDIWNEFKKRYFEVHEKRCCSCDSEFNIRLHHKHYRNRGKELFSDMTVLCNSCHTLTHKFMKSGLMSNYHCNSENAHEFLNKLTSNDLVVVRAVSLD